MTKEEYKESIKAIDLMAQTKRNELMTRYASSNNPHKVGDIVTDHMGSVIIEEIKCFIGMRAFPSSVYYGLELKKDKSPQKNGGKRLVHQINLIK